MNILFVGPYRQEDEWGRKSRAILQALQKTDHSVTARPLFLTENLVYNEYMEKAEFVTNDEYDILIQFTLQPHIVYDGNVKKRIGIFNTETLPHEIARGHLTKELLMDEIWVDSPQLETAVYNTIQNYNPNIKVRAIPPLLDITNLPAQAGGSLIAGDPDLKDRFIFYYIGNLLEEKSGFKETFLAYMTSFTHKDAVALLCASEVAGNQNDLENIVGQCQAAVGNFRNSNERPLFKVVGGQGGGMHVGERVALHCDGNCMVSPHYSIATNSIVLEAAMYQSTPIVNKGNASYEWWGEENLWGVDSYEELCLTLQRPVPYRFTAGELWHKPIIKSLQKVMKDVYINKFERDKKIAANAKLRSDFETACLNVEEDSQ